MVRSGYITPEDGVLRYPVTNGNFWSNFAITYIVYTSNTAATAYRDHFTDTVSSPAINANRYASYPLRCLSTE